jgi:hypothetical protein
MLVFAQSENIRDCLSLDGLYWMATNAGLAVGDSGKALVFHRPGGLPVTELLRIALFRDEIIALAPEGLLAVRGAGQVRLGELTIELYAPAEETQFSRYGRGGRNALAVGFVWRTRPYFSV